MRDPVSQRPAHLDRRALAARGATEQVGDHRGHQDERRHALGHDLLRIVDLVDQQVVAALDALADAVIDPAGQEPCERQQPDEPRMIHPRIGGAVQGKEEKRGGRPGQGAEHGGQQQPAREIRHHGDLFDRLETFHNF